jgi:hypothetical protein
MLEKIVSVYEKFFYLGFFIVLEIVSVYLLVVLDSVRNIVYLLEI